MEWRWSHLLPGLLLVHAAMSQPQLEGWYKVDPTTNSGYYRGMVNVDKGFTMAGRPFHVDSADTFDVLLLHLDSLGEVLWAREYAIPGSQAIAGLVRHPDGSSMAVLDHNPTGSPGETSILLRLDEQEQVLWARELLPVDGRSLRAQSIVLLPDGGVVVTGEVIDPLNSTQAPMLLKVDTTGTVLWSREVVGQVGYLFNVCALPDGGVAVTGSGVDTAGVQGLVVMRVSAGGALQWARHFSDGGFCRGNGISYSVPAGLLVCGYGPSGTFPGIVLRMDGNGQVWDAFRLQHEPTDGHSFADSSMMLFMRLPGGSAAMARVRSDLTVLCSMNVGTTLGDGQFLAFQDRSRFAWFAGDFTTDRLYLRTMAPNCISCVNAPGPSVGLSPQGLTEGGITLGPVPLALDTPWVTVGTHEGQAQRLSDCGDWVGLPERTKTPVRSCRQEPGMDQLLLSGGGPWPAEVSVHDPMGRTLVIFPLTGEPVGADAFRMALPPHLPTGLLVLHAGAGRSCILWRNAY